MKVEVANAVALFDAGWTAVEEGDFDQAHAIGRRLKALRFSGAFEILALVHGHQDKFGSACKVLEAGVKRAPKVWRLW